MESSEDFTSFVNEFAAVAKLFGRASLPTEQTTEKEADLPSSISMETTQTTHTPCDITPTEGRSTPSTPPMLTKEVDPQTYVIQESPDPPPPEQIFYGPCPNRRNHSNFTCSTCKLTAEQYRLERLAQSRIIYSNHSKNFAKHQEATKPPPPINPPRNFGQRLSTFGNSYGGGFARSSISTTSSTTKIQNRFSILKEQQQQQQFRPARMSMFAISNTHQSSARPSISIAQQQQRLSLNPRIVSRENVLISDSRSSVISNYAPRKGPLPKFVDTTLTPLRSSINLLKPSSWDTTHPPIRSSFNLLHDRRLSNIPIIEEPKKEYLAVDETQKSFTDI